jgi:hypothetical protein
MHETASMQSTPDCIMHKASAPRPRIIVAIEFLVSRRFCASREAELANESRGA